MKEKIKLTNENIKRAKIDKEFLSDLIETNSDLIWFSIHKYITINNDIKSTCGITNEDLYQIGCMAFLKAINLFDETKGYKFVSYVVASIVKEITHYLRSNYSLMRVPRSSLSILQKIKDIEMEEGKLPSIEELAKRLNISETRVKQILNVNNFVKSLNEKKDNNHDSFDILSSHENLVEDIIEDKLFLEDLFNSLKNELNEKEEKILKLMLAGNNQEDTAKDLQLSSMTVSRTVKKIRKILAEKYNIKE